MKRISIFILGCFVAGSAYSVTPVNNAPLDYSSAVIDFNKLDLAKSYQDGVNIRKAREEKKAYKKHLAAMKELEQLDLTDQQAVMNFAKSYPNEIDSLKELLDLQKQLQ